MSPKKYLFPACILLGIISYLLVACISKPTQRQLVFQQEYNLGDVILGNSVLHIEFVNTSSVPVSILGFSPV
jgi:hypothetical protein